MICQSMKMTYENCLSLVNSCIYYAHQTHEIYPVLPYSVDFKAPQSSVVSFEIHWIKQYLVHVNVVLYEIKGL